MSKNIIYVIFTFCSIDFFFFFLNKNDVTKSQYLLVAPKAAQDVGACSNILFLNEQNPQKQKDLWDIFYSTVQRVC